MNDEQEQAVLDAMRVADSIVFDGDVVRKGTGRYDATVIHRRGGDSYRAHVHADGHKDQSYLEVSVWLPSQGWTTVLRFDGYDIEIASPYAKGADAAERIVPTQLDAAISRAIEIVEGRS